MWRGENFTRYLKPVPVAEETLGTINWDREYSTRFNSVRVIIFISVRNINSDGTLVTLLSLMWLICRFYFSAEYCKCGCLQAFQLYRSVLCILHGTDLVETGNCLWIAICATRNYTQCSGFWPEFCLSSALEGPPWRGVRIFDMDWLRYAVLFEEVGWPHFIENFLEGRDSICHFLSELAKCRPQKEVEYNVVLHVYRSSFRSYSNKFTFLGS